MSETFYYFIDRLDGYGYEDMLKVLWNTPFEVKVGRDVNLLNEANDFRYNHGLRNDNPGNCLEILYQLSYKMDSLLYDGDHGPRYVEWFWLMIKNMGLIIFDNENFNYKEVKRKVDIFSQRKYKPDGKGGPFPLQRPISNMKKVDYWYQLNYYVNENFEYEFTEEDDYE